MGRRGHDEHASAAAPRLAISRPARGWLKLQLSESWRVTEAVPEAELVQREIEAERPDRLVFDTSEIMAWDSSLVAFVARVLVIARAAKVTVDRSGLPPGVQRLLALAEATPIRAEATGKPPASLLARIGTRALAWADSLMEVLAWCGELTVAFGKLLIGRAKFRPRDLLLQLQLTGAQAFGIVSLVAALVGLIIAFISAVQLQSFGATLYVANLVGLAMIRDLGAVIAAIVVAGRTGASFAAELGTMRVTQEIDALTTLGISPIEFLVLPRLIAVTLMLPLLCVYSDLLGVVGGALVGIGIMHITPRIYLDQTIGAVSFSDLFGGLIKATTYGFLIGAAGCYQGLQSGRTAAAVGKAATSAVVASIVLIITACGLYAVIFYRLGL
jgi:phospholipid/cholesterol/gamma-HCH transport system permease protein